MYTGLERFRIKSGELSQYAFVCGYLQQIELDNTRLTLWHEGACYHVRAHEFEGRGRLFWNSFESLTEARKCYRKAKRSITTTKGA